MEKKACMHVFVRLHWSCCSTKGAPGISFWASWVTVEASTAAATQATMATAAEPAAGVPRVMAVLSSSHFDEGGGRQRWAPRRPLSPLSTWHPTSGAWLKDWVGLGFGWLMFHGK
jgi:hypothetical protein